MPAAAVLYVKDLTTMKAFYETCFGMSTAEADGDRSCVLTSDAWELALVRVPDAIASTLVITDPPERRETASVKLAFAVADIEGHRALVAERGGRIDPAESAWAFRGHRHLDCVDPEGNVVQLRQRLAA